MQLTEEPDKLSWRWENLGQYSSCSAYCVLFFGRTRFQHAPIWKSFVPPRCRYFLWLVTLNRCWTADHLQSRGLPHPDRCPLCDQGPETIDHLLVACPESRQLWWIALSVIGHAECLPLNERSFHGWLCDSRKKLTKDHRRVSTPSPRWQLGQFGRKETIGSLTKKAEPNQRSLGRCLGKRTFGGWLGQPFRSW